MDHDVYLPTRWDRLLLDQYRMGEKRFAPIGVAGVNGSGRSRTPTGRTVSRRAVPSGRPAIGWVEDLGRVLSKRLALPAPVARPDVNVVTVSTTQMDRRRRMRQSAVPVRAAIPTDVMNGSNVLCSACDFLFLENLLTCGSQRTNVNFLGTFPECAFTKL